MIKVEITGIEKTGYVGIDIYEDGELILGKGISVKKDSAKEFAEYIISMFENFEPELEHDTTDEELAF